MTSPPSLLRAPPFPGVAAAVASVGGDPAAGVVPTDGEVDAVLDALRAARVGGAFWAAPGRDEARTIVRADRRAGEAVDPWSLLAPGRELVAHGDDDWVAVARIAGAQVRLLSPGRFGQPDDNARAGRRRIAATLLGASWRDPFSGKAASLYGTIALLAFWRELIEANRPVVAATGMAWWKRGELRRFLWAPRPAPLRFLPGALAVGHAARRGGTLAAWPSRLSDTTRAAAQARGVPIVQVEDGFIRSVGLGADLVPPLSVAVDRLGIHYDPSGPSEMERLLADIEPSPALLARARALREMIVARGISKYGAGVADTVFPQRQAGRRLVLVPGQVEDDRSVLLGGGQVAGNLDLLRRARAAEPEAEIWFRPHPDVDAGHRRGGLRDADALRHATHVVRGGSMAALLDRVDAVHVLTSLTGFEALLRGRHVTCHGTPFYAGWGLTRDLGPVPARRGRRLELDALVAVVLVLYPRYLDPVTKLPCPVEVLVERLAEPVAGPGWLVRLRRLQGRLMRSAR